MADKPPLSVNGHAVQHLQLHIGNIGPWTASVQLTQAVELQIGTAATLTVGGATLTGTVVETASFALGTAARIVAGHGGWSNVIARRDYHNDAGIKASLVAGDVARECGETLGGFEPESERLGADYVRPERTGAWVLEDVIGEAAWWVDFAGVTQVGTRPSAVASADAGTLLSFAPRDNVALLAIDSLAGMVPGVTLRDTRLNTDKVIRDLEVVSTNGSALRATAWCADAAADSDTTRDRLSALIESIVTHVTKRELHGVYRYRVIAMRGDKRVDLQAVRKAVGLPDVQAAQQYPGIPGMAAELTEGAEVLVQFVDGDPREPLITHYAGPGTNGFAPVGIVIGDDAGEAAARQGDTVQVLLPPALFNGTINGLPATGAVTFLTPTADGQITGGSGKVRIA